MFLSGMLLAGSASAVRAAPTDSALMPYPASYQPESGRLPVTAEFRVAWASFQSPRLVAAVARTLRAIEQRSGLTLPRSPTGEYPPAAHAATAALVIECAAASAPVPRLGEDESYRLEIGAGQARLNAPTEWGVLRGLATLTQLLQSDATGWFLPAAVIADQPRFPWRGLMIDVCRHWQPREVIERNLDGMALVKLNVLHLHLTDDQGFRIESRKFPRLQERGSDGHYFTQDEMRGIIAYAAARGIRVVPEFDLPGHATSWVTAYPELASAPGPYVLERKWGVFNPVLDPTNEAVYPLLDGFLGEMAALFPDEYLHIGGDENNGVQWNANSRIQAFIREHRLKDNAGLHAWFNGRVQAILARKGKKLVGWDEILHPDLPAGSVVHSWRGPDGIAAATRHGFPTILSNGYYIDLCESTARHYLNDPLPPGNPLTADERRLVLGGEATMWAEWVTPETIDSRIWPRTAAIAERLWSPAGLRDVPDMYRRLAVVSRRLEEAGLRHESYLGAALRRLAGDAATAADLAALRTFVDVIEPVKGYKRANHQPNANQFTPLTGLVDCARPDSAGARAFAAAVAGVAVDQPAPEASAALTTLLTSWREAAGQLLARLPELSPRLAEAEPVLRAWRDAASTGLAAAEARQHGRIPDGPALEAAIAAASQPHAAVELPIAPALARLAGTAK
ncbi:MAG TPA: family 20 glycosylhydrolase [Lacunisphaera sp.]|nr:family 20 glycosylhydrolase [Lacunisphaera sp.]